MNTQTFENIIVKYSSESCHTTDSILIVVDANIPFLNSKLNTKNIIVLMNQLGFPDQRMRLLRLILKHQKFETNIDSDLIIAKMDFNYISYPYHQDFEKEIKKMFPTTIPSGGTEESQDNYTIDVKGCTIGAIGPGAVGKVVDGKPSSEYSSSLYLGKRKVVDGIAPGTKIKISKDGSTFTFTD